MTKEERERIIKWLYDFAKKQNDAAEEYKKEAERLKDILYENMDEIVLRKEIARYHRYRMYCEGTAEHIDEIIDFIRKNGMTEEDAAKVKTDADAYAKKAIEKLPAKYSSEVVIKALKEAYINGANLDP